MNMVTRVDVFFIWTIATIVQCHIGSWNSRDKTSVTVGCLLLIFIPLIAIVLTVLFVSGIMSW